MSRPRKTPIGEPVSSLLKLTGTKTIPELAGWLELPFGTVANWDKRKSIPHEQEARAIRMAHERKNLNSAREPEPGFPLRLRREPIEVCGAEITFNLGEDRHFEVIPRYSARVSAGRGEGEQHDEQVGEFAFEVSWMRRNLGRSGKGFGSVLVRGDSMEPTLLNGDEIIIDRQAVRVDVNGIYVIALRGDLLVKRVQRMLDGSLVVRSDNPAYQPETLSADKAEDFRVVGRMVWPRVR